MRRKILTLAVLLFLASVIPLEAATLDALPSQQEGNLFLVVNVNDGPALLGRLGKFLTDKGLAGSEGALPSWPDPFPVSSISLVIGQNEEGFSLQGALAFSESTKEILQKLACGEGEPSDLDALLGFSLAPACQLVPFDEGIYSVIHQGMALVLLSVEKDYLLVGFSPEDLAHARQALGDGTKRLALDRQLLQEDFLFFRDNGFLADKIGRQAGKDLGEPQGALTAELGLDLSPEEWCLAGRSNIYNVFPGLDKEKLASPLTAPEKILLGGGEPWFVALGKIFFDRSHLQVLREAAAEGQEEASQVLAFLEEAESLGIDVEGLLTSMRAAGVVLGGEGRAQGHPLPGGYVYLAAEKGAFSSLVPLVEELVTESGLAFRRLDHGTWDQLFVLDDPVDVILALGEEVLLVGFLSGHALDLPPAMTPSMSALVNRDDLVEIFHVDGRRLRHGLVLLLDPENPWAALMVKEGLADGVIAFLNTLQLTLELETVQFGLHGLDRFDLILATGKVDPQEEARLEALSSRWLEWAAPLEETASGDAAF